MCGISLIFLIKQFQNIALLRQRALEMSRRIRHRGPDWSGLLYSYLKIIL
jgi:asparagine synthase (glutamine-hydrolysing)